MRLSRALSSPEGRAAIEADLSLHYGLDLRDHYRRDDDGRPLLTLRQIMVRLRHLPWDSAYRHLGARPTARFWTAEAEVLDEQRRMTAMVHFKGHQDPGPHRLSPASPTREERLTKARERRRQHEANEAREAARQRWIAEQAQEVT